jgi:hypothetical protein
MADNLKACQSMASSVTDSNQSTAIEEEICAEHLAMAQENLAARQQQNEQTQQFMSMFMQFQHMMSNLFLADGPPPSAFFPPGHPPFDPAQQQYLQHQHQCGWHPRHQIQPEVGRLVRETDC